MLRLRDLIQASVNALLASLGVLVLMSVAFVPQLIELFVRLDLHSYAKVVRSSSCSLHDKERLLDQIDELDRKVQDGAKITALRWAEFHDAVGPLLAALGADEVRLLERELQRLEAEIANAQD